MEGNFNKFNKIVHFEPVNSSVPDVVRNRVDQTLSSLPKRKYLKKKISYGLVAMTALCAGTFTVGCMSPAAAEKLSGIPVLGSYFQNVLSYQINSSNKKLLQNSPSQVPQDGISLQIKNVMFDNGELKFGVYLYYNQEIPEKFQPSGKVNKGLIECKGSMEINNDPIPLQDFTQVSNSNNVSKTSNASNLTYFYNNDFWHRETGREYSCIIDYKNNALPANTNIHIEFQQIGNIKGHWVLDLPITKINTEKLTKTYIPNITKKLDDVTLTIKKVQVSPFNTTVDYELDHPNIRPIQRMFDSIKNIGYMSGVGYDLSVYDDKAEAYISIGANDVSVQQEIKVGNTIKDFCQVHYISHESIPKYLVFDVSRTDYDSFYQSYKAHPPQIQRVSLNSLPATFDRGMYGGGEIRFTKVQYLKDKTLLYYDILSNDKDPGVFVSRNFDVIEDGRMIVGNNDVFKGPYRVNDVGNSFVLEMPPLDPSKHQYKIEVAKNDYNMGEDHLKVKYQLTTDNTK